MAHHESLPCTYPQLQVANLEDTPPPSPLSNVNWLPRGPFHHTDLLTFIQSRPTLEGSHNYSPPTFIRHVAAIYWCIVSALAHYDCTPCLCPLSTGMASFLLSSLAFWLFGLVLLIALRTKQAQLAAGNWHTYCRDMCRKDTASGKRLWNVVWVQMLFDWLWLKAPRRSVGRRKR